MPTGHSMSWSSATHAQDKARRPRVTVVGPHISVGLHPRGIATTRVRDRSRCVRQNCRGKQRPVYATGTQAKSGDLHVIFGAAGSARQSQRAHGVQRGPGLPARGVGEAVHRTLAPDPGRTQVRRCPPRRRFPIYVLGRQDRRLPLCPVEAFPWPMRRTTVPPSPRVRGGHPSVNSSGNHSIPNGGHEGYGGLGHATPGQLTAVLFPP
jgi:hypothetical protein